MLEFGHYDENGNYVKDGVMSIEEYQEYIRTIGNYVCDNRLADKLTKKDERDRFRPVANRKSRRAKS